MCPEHLIFLTSLTAHLGEMWMFQLLCVDGLAWCENGGELTFHGCLCGEIKCRILSKKIRHCSGFVWCGIVHGIKRCIIEWVGAAGRHASLQHISFSHLGHALNAFCCQWIRWLRYHLWHLLPEWLRAHFALSTLRQLIRLVVHRLEFLSCQHKCKFVLLLEVSRLLFYASTCWRPIIIKTEENMYRLALTAPSPEPSWVAFVMIFNWLGKMCPLTSVGCTVKWLWKQQR